MKCSESVQAYLKLHGSRFSCSEQEGALWVNSPFLHPDGDGIEIVIEERSNGHAVVSDVGETLRHLGGLAFDPRANAKSEYLMERALKSNNVELQRGAIWKEVANADVGEAIQDVLAAAVGVSHLIYLSRGYRPKTFAEEVAYLLQEAEVDYEQGVFEFGVSGSRYRIDFKIEKAVPAKLIHTLSPASVAGEKTMVNSAFRMYSDIPSGSWKAVILDDRYVPWRAEDLRLLAGISHVYHWTVDYTTIAEEIVGGGPGGSQDMFQP